MWGNTLRMARARVAMPPRVSTPRRRKPRARMLLLGQVPPGEVTRLGLPLHGICMAKRPRLGIPLHGICMGKRSQVPLRGICTAKRPRLLRPIVGETLHAARVQAPSLLSHGVMTLVGHDSDDGMYPR